MNVFVTGGTGFTGAALVERLLADGHSVTVLDNKPGLIADKLRAAGAEIHFGSITDRDSVAAAIGKPEVVFHLAAAFRETGASDALYKSVNVDGTRITVEESIRVGARKIVYCSTQGVHGHIDHPPGDENSPIAPADYYQQTKYEGELVLEEFADANIEFTTLRPTAIYGPGDPERFVMIYRRAKKGFFPIFGTGQAFYHPVYIDNLVDAFVLSMEQGKGAGEAYIIGDEQYFSIRALVHLVAKSIDAEVSTPTLPLMPLIVAGHVCEKICKPFGINPPIFPRRVDWFRQMRAFRIDKAKRDLGYEPSIGIEEGLRRTGVWYIENNYI